MQVAPRSAAKNGSGIPKFLYIIGGIILLLGILSKSDIAGSGCCLILIGLLISALTPKKKTIPMTIVGGQPIMWFSQLFTTNPCMLGLNSTVASRWLLQTQSPKQKRWLSLQKKPLLKR